jgi:pimeloyl-ACP methyl ester carboxylesterase
MHKQDSNKLSHTTTTTITSHRSVIVDGLSIFHRETGDPTKPKLLLLHGFPSSSHQYRKLMSVLADRLHIISPDYPGFGNSDMPDRSKFAYTFDKLAEIVEGLLKQISFTQFGLYVQDYGGPIGFRIINHHPDCLKWLIIQNSNAYEIGFTKAWDGFRNSLWKNRTPETESPLAAFLRMEAIKQIYLYRGSGAYQPG